jgi:hypothetical protein
MNDLDRRRKMVTSHCECLQYHIVQCLNDSDASFHYEEMMSFFRNLHPELCGWVLQSTLEQWNSDPDSGEYHLCFE